jgi:hypothetical protein
LIVVLVAITHPKMIAFLNKFDSVL